MMFEELPESEQRAALMSEMYLQSLKTKYPNIDFSIIEKLKEKYKVNFICRRCHNEFTAALDKVPPLCIACGQEPITLGPSTLARWFREHYIFATTFDSAQNLYIYDEKEGVYSQEEAEAIISKECNILLGDKLSGQKLNNAILSLKATTYLEKSEFRGAYYEENNIIYYNLRNGILQFNKKDYSVLFGGHSPKFYFRNKLNIIYDPNAKTPEKFLNFLAQISNSEENFINLLESFAFPLMVGYPIQRSIALVGGGKNGKSTYLKALELFYGERDISHLTLQQLSHAIEGQPFALIQLTNKIANVADDLPDRPVKSVGYFKQLTGGSSVEAERKFGGRVAFTNSAKFYFAANSMPAVNEDTVAFYRRFLFIEFSNIIEKVRDQREVMAEICSDEEKSGLFLILIGLVLPKLLKKNDFTFCKSTEEVAEQYNKHGNTAELFFRRCTSYDWSSVILKEDITQAYSEFCNINNLTEMSEKMLYRTLKTHWPKSQETRTQEEGVRKFKFRGFVLNFEKIAMPLESNNMLENSKKIEKEEIIKNYFIDSAILAIFAILFANINLNIINNIIFNISKNYGNTAMGGTDKPQNSNILLEKPQNTENSNILLEKPQDKQETTTKEQSEDSKLKQTSLNSTETPKSNIPIPQSHTTPQNTQKDATQANPIEQQEVILQVLSAVKLATKLKLPQFWKDKDQGEPAPQLNSALAGLYQNQIEWALLDLARAGDIYEPKPGRWRVVQHGAEEE